MKIIIFVIVALVTNFTCQAFPAIDGNFTLKSGDYAIDISGKYKYCITRIIYDGYAIGNSKGFYGTILAPKTTKFIGAGHTEGGVEDVKSIEVIVDGQPQSITLNAVFEGRKIEFKKVSQLDKLLVFMTITLDDAGIKIEKNYEALVDQEVFSLYVFQFCWSNETDQWMIGRPDGTIGEGKFNSDMGWHLRSERELYWYALFNSAKDKGILGYFADYYPKQGQYMWWDKHIYHKFYYWAATPKVISKGTEATLEARRTRAVAWFNSKGIPNEKICELFSLINVHEITLEILQTLTGYRNAVLQDGADINEIFKTKVDEMTEAKSDLKKKKTSGKTEKKTTKPKLP